MAKRKTPSLALSEYVPPAAENSTELWRARLEMIEAVKRIYPKFLETLLAEVFPLYCQLAEAGKLAKAGNNFEKALWGDSPYEALTEDGGLKTALSKWAADFNAEADWLIVGALRTLQGWHVSPDWRESLKWDATLGRSETAAIGEAFEFRYQGWEVRLLTWSAYSKSLRQRFEEKLLEYEKMTRQLSESRGLVPTKGLFALASYDAGPHRIEKLRPLAAAEGYDPNLWFNNVEFTAARRIGADTPNYVSNIYKYYLAYKMTTEQDARRQASRSAPVPSQTR